MVELVVITVVI